MKKKSLLILMILIIGIIPIVFFGCNSKVENNISLEEITNVLVKENTDVPYVDLTLNDEENSSKVIAFKITNFRDEISSEISFSSDSNAISIPSDKITYYPNGVVEITVKAENGGTAIVTATSAQFSKNFTFVVNVIEPIESISIKSDKNTIYYEIGRELIVDLNQYVNFFPKTTTERTLSATINETAVNVDANNKITLSGIQNDCTLKIKSTKLDSEQTLNIKVVQPIQNISLTKEVFNSNGEKTQQNFAKDASGNYVLELLKNNNAKTTANQIVAYSERNVELIVKTTQANLKVSAKVYNKNGEQVDSLVGDILSTTYSNNEYTSKIKFAYVGYDELKYIFTFSYLNYTYAQTQEIFVKTLEAPNSLTINNVQSSSHSIDVYTQTENYIGKALKFGVNQNTKLNYLINLYFNDEIGTSKTSQTSDISGYSNKVVLANNNETIRVFATRTEQTNSTILARVAFEFEGVSYYFESEINVSIKHTPNDIIIKDESSLSVVENSITEYYLDLNNSGYRIDATGKKVVNNAQNSKTLYVFGRVNQSLENNHNFTISSNISCVDVEINKETQSFTITAKSVGTGRFYVTLESGQKITFTVIVINSLREFDISFPTPIQNRNILETKVVEGEYQIIAKTATLIPLIYTYSGNASNFNVSDIDNKLVYSNGYLICNENTDAYISATFSCNSSYLDNNGIQPITNKISFKIKFFTPISSFGLTTNKGGNVVKLYDLNTVGYYSYELSSLMITVNVNPNEIKKDILENIVWKDNYNSLEKDEINSTTSADKYTSKIYTLEYNKKTGVATVLCRIDRYTIDDNGATVYDADIVGENGKLILENLILIAEIENGSTGVDQYNAASFVAINLAENTKTEEIVSSVDSISLDFYKKSVDISTVIYPLDATNKQLSAVFIPNDYSYMNLVEISQSNGVFKVSINENSTIKSGRGIIRIIAKDSYTDESNFTTFVDIPVQVSDGTAEYPYQIITSSDLAILSETGFSKYYQIIGNINASNFDFSNATFSGVLFGINNATLSGITVESGNDNNFGFFNENTGTILNVKFEGKIELTNLFGTCNIGLVAGTNSGTLQNVCAEVSSISLTTDSYQNNIELNVGGVVGLNAGTIATDIQDEIYTFEQYINLNLDYKKFADVKNLTFTNNISQENTTFYFGGVAGKTTGNIKAINTSTKSEVNNNFTSVNININSNIAAKTTAIGGVVGYAKSQPGQDLLISGLKAMGKISASSNNNIGGIAGYSSINIKNCISRVQIDGNQYIGGIVGHLDGAIVSYCKVQNLSNNNVESPILTGNTNIGGIVGLFEGSNAQVGHSTFISYLSNNNVYDIVASGANASFGRLVGQGELNGDFNVAIASVSATGTYNITTNKTNTAIFDRIGSANYFDGGFINALTEGSGYNFSSLQEFISQIQKYESDFNVPANVGKEPKTSYIILPPTEITLNLTNSGNMQQLEATNGGSEIVFYLINPEKIGEEQTKTEVDLSEYILAKANSNTGVNFVSADTNILTFNSEGKVKLVGTGLVKITVTSEFNKNLKKEFYVYVINQLNDFSAYRKADRMSSQITSNTLEILDKDTTYMLYFKFVDKFNTQNFVEPTQVNVAIKINGTYYYPGKVEDGISFTKLSPEAYQLQISSLTTSSTPISFVYYLQATIDEKEYRFVAGDKLINGIQNGIQNINFNYRVVSETKSLNISETDIEVMPYYSPTVDVSVNTENEDEQISVRVENKTDPTNTISLNYEIWMNDSKISTINNKFNLKQNGTLNKNFAIKFNLTKEIKESQEFVVTLITSNRIKKQINIKFVPQTPSYVDVVLYEETSSANEYEYFPSTKIVPSPSTALLQISLFPEFADYDYVIVKNIAGNEYNLNFQLFNRTDKEYVEGAKYVDGGIKINKNLIENGTFELRMYVDSKISDLASVGIEIDVFKNEKSVLAKPVLKTYYIEKLPGVAIEIDGTKSGNTETLLLAKNVEYDVNLIVKGYQTNAGAMQLDQSTATYTDGDIKFQLNNASLATLIKDANGTYSIIPKEVGELTIITYGEVLTSEGIQKSNETQLKIQIVDFVVKSSSDQDLIKDSIEGVIAKALGKTYVFEVTLNSDVLVYNKADAVVVNEVKTLLEELSKSLYVKVYDKNANETAFADTELNKVFKIDIDATNNKLTITFKRLEDSLNPTYTFKFEAEVKYKPKAVYVGGTKIIGAETSEEFVATRKLEQEFRFNITERTTRNNPYPVYDENDLNNMVEGNYYILLEDISLSSSFRPLTTLVGGFDGNNHKIIFPDGYSLSNPDGNVVARFGLFETVAENALIQNVIIEVPQEITLTSFAEVEFGLICAENFGNITNCAVVGKTNRLSVNVNDTIDSNNVSSHIVAGLVARNNAKASITNSRMLVSISSTANMAGLVYENLGTISSSYVYGSVINNTSSTNSTTAGFVGINGTGALTFASYIKGDYLKTTDSFATSYEKLVYSESTVGAFIHTNSGTISNCYANIPVSQGASRASGFVYKNEKGALIEYSYSTSMMASKNRNHTSFIGRSVTNLLNEGTIKECFAMENGIINFPSNKTGEINVSDITFANYELGANVIEGLTILGSFDDYTKQTTVSGTYLTLSDGSHISIKDSGAAELYDSSDKIVWANEALKNQSTFERFAFSPVGYATEGIWFMPASENMPEYVGIKLSPYKPELVSPNILSLAMQEFTNTTVNEQTGQTIYNYDLTQESKDAGYIEGSLHNPFIVQTYEDLENIIDEPSKNYRLITDITYITGSSYSNLYNLTFNGVLEGNGFTIGNYIIDSSNNFASAGFFGTLRKENEGGVIKNVTFAPRYINLPNAQSVGAVVGSIYDGSILNVNIDGYKYDALGGVVLGKNAVGGVAGIAYGNYLINGINSNISVNAGYLASINNKDVEIFNKFNLQNVSHAGLILGIASGNGRIYYTHAGGDNVSIGECAGLMFGFVGKNVLVDNAEAVSSLNQSIKANVFAGVIAAVNEGTIQNSSIKDSLNKNSFFVNKIYTPIAVGNVVGYMISGTLNNIKVETNTIVQTSIQAVGGAVGAMKSGKINNVVVYGDVSGGSVVGGLVGYAGEILAKGFTGQPLFKELSFAIEIVDSYLDSTSGEIISTSSSDSVKVGTIIGWANGITTSETSWSDNALTLTITKGGTLKIRYNSTIENNKKYVATINNDKFNVMVNIRFGAVVYSNVNTYKEVCSFKGYKNNDEGSAPGSFEDGGPTINQADTDKGELINDDSMLKIVNGKVVRTQANS